MQRLTLAVKTTRDRTRDVPGYIVVPGLAVHKRINPRTGKLDPTDWTVSHVGSGLCVTPPGIVSCPTKTAALRLAQLMARELNWEAECSEAIFAGTPYENKPATWRERLVSIREAYEAGSQPSPTESEVSMPPKDKERELTAEEKAIQEAEKAVKEAKDRLKAARKAAKQATCKPVYELAGQVLAETDTGDCVTRLAELTGRESKTYAKVIKDAGAAIRGYLAQQKQNG